MGYRIMQTRLAERDLGDIVDYILLTLENRPAAAALLDAVESCYDDLTRMPDLYEACRDPYLHALGYRKAVIRRYIMIYKVDEANKTVTILRFFHGSQDYERLI